MRWPLNGDEKVVMTSQSSIWAFLFGPLYYACKGMWFVALMSILTFNGLWLGFPIWNRSLILRHYYFWGWKII